MTETAYYYPAPYWARSEHPWIKSLLLFFDDIAILLPHYMHGRHRDADPSLAGPLEERGLLRVLEPNDWVGPDMAHDLSNVMVELITGGTFDDLPKAQHYAELSMSRMGYSADVALAEFLVSELQERDLARPSEDGVSVPLHPTVRSTILVILAQLCRVSAKGRGLTFHPATSSAEAAQDLFKIFSRESMPSKGDLIRLDLEPVALDLALVPLEDVLQFRSENGESYKAYRRDLHRFMAELASVPEAQERTDLLLERQEELAEAALKTRREARRTLGKSLGSWSLGIAGSAWAVGTGDLFGALLAAAGLVAARTLKEPERVTAYSYLFEASRVFRT